MEKYKHKEIEEKWQKYWEETGAWKAENNSKKEKFFALVEFPYPSGAGLHIGHPRSYTAMDVISRKKRAEGLNVLYPIGWDAFGLPTENYAIKTGIHPIKVTEQNTDTFRRQLKSIGFSFDWSREINTTDPEYYKWTQWIFLQLHKKGLAYKDKMPINWCTSCKIGLANEEVVDGACERCGGEVEKREKEQWMLAITKYAERLDKDLDDVDFLDRIKVQQRNWIGKSEGAELEFEICNLKFENNEQISNEKIGKVKVFTTRPDTLFGATYLVLAPEHELVASLLANQESRIRNKEEIEAYIKEASKKKDIDRTAEGREKTGVELKGIKAINPANGEEIPIFIADYVLAHYGTGAIMAVPAHDERDFEFAKKYGLEVRQVIAKLNKHEINEDEKTEIRHTVLGIVKNTKNNTVLCLEWENGWRSFPSGGIEDSEDVIGGIKREIAEETGYKNLELIKKVGDTWFETFWRPHKKSNVFAKMDAYLFELVDNDRCAIDDTELSKHKPVWIKEREVGKWINTSGPKTAWWQLNNEDSPYIGDGILVNSGKFNGMESEEAKRAITEFVGGKMKTTFKLRDWVFSRQRYWGEPIPMVHCENCGIVPLPESELPLTLPDVEKYEPTDTGESPLANITDWVNTSCPKCGGSAKRETDTMPNWAGSSWYFLRYADPHNSNELASKEALNYWTPIDWYNGGMEHTTLHLLYSRFWHKFLFDIGVVPTHEPYAKRTSHGMILASDGRKMSKSLGNVINPDEIVESYGADTLRTYEMFMGPFDQPISWSTESMIGTRRWLERVWMLFDKISDNEDDDIERELHKIIKKVSEDIEAMKFNTAIASMMSFTNKVEKAGLTKRQYSILLQLLSPFAPHITEELWELLGNDGYVSTADWPSYDEDKLTEDTITIAVQVNGKLRANLTVDAGLVKEDILREAKELDKIQKWLEGKDVKKEIFVPGRLVNFVV